MSQIPVKHCGRVLAEMGVETFTTALRAAGFRGVAQQAPRLGFGTGPGGRGTNPKEPTGLCAALADGGR